MDLQLGGKVALITGGSRGLGFAAAKALANEGATVAISARNVEGLRMAALEISETTHNSVTIFPADLTVGSELERLVDRIEEAHGALDILVVSTGHPPTKTATEASALDWAEGVALLLKPAVDLTRIALPRMQSRGFGRVIFLASIFALVPERDSAVQSVFRSGVLSLAKCASREVNGPGVTINVICPGYFDTPLVHELARKVAASSAASSEEILAAWRQASPLHQLGNPDQLGSLVAFIASPVAGFIHGTRIVIDGGLLATP